MIVTISPDENPGDTGSVSADGIPERQVNIGVATMLRLALERCGVEARFDPSLTYEQRVAIANQDGTDVLVACAHNESTAGLSGTQFVFCPGGTTTGHQSVAAANVYSELAQLALIVDQLGRTRIGHRAMAQRVLVGWPRRIGDAVENVYECCAFERDTVYTEYLFMSPQDRALWGAVDYPFQAAEATCRGLAATYGFQYIPSQQDPDRVSPDVPDPTASTAREGRRVLAIVYLSQLHVFWIDAQGKLQHQWFGAGSTSWQSEVLADGLEPGQLLSSEQFGGQLHVFGPRTDGKVQHSWYPAGAQGWGSEVLVGVAPAAS